MEFEDILEKVGGYGKYQRKLTVLFIIPVSLIIPFFWLNKIFIMSVPDHMCHIPELMSTNLSIAQQKVMLSPPDDPSCSMYQMNYTAFKYTDTQYVTPNDSVIIPCNNGWQYDKENYDSTAATKWNLVCAYSEYTSLVFTLSHVGSLFGTPLYGLLSDKFGRKISFLTLVVVTSATELASVLVDNFVAFAVLRTINGTALPSIFSLYYVLIIEIVSPKMRTHMYGITHLFWTVGLCTLSLVAYLSRSWILLGLITSFAGFFMLSYWRYLPESPSWLLSQNRCEEATVILMKIGKENEKPQKEEDIFKQLKTLSERNRNRTEKESNDPKIQFFKYHRILRNFLILCVCWSSSNVTYYGLFYNMRNLKGNEFINFFLLSVFEFPGIIAFWYLNNRFGRRWTATAVYFAVAVVCIMPLIEFPLCDLMSSIIGNFLTVGAAMITHQQGSELFPTEKRSFYNGIGKTVATAVTLLVPYIVDQNVCGKTAAFLIISFISLTASVLTSFLPETMNRNLPQTFFEAEEFGKEQKFFSWNRQMQSTNSVPVEQTRF